MKKRIAIILLIIVTVAISVFADDTRVRRASAAWDMDLEVIQYLPLKLSFVKTEIPSGNGTTVSNSNFAFQEAAEFRVNFKYMYLSAYFDYTYSSDDTKGTHGINPMFRLGGRIPVIDIFWIELFGGAGGYFLIQDYVDSTKPNEELDCFAFQLGLNLRFFINDLISLNGGILFMGAYPTKMKVGNVSASVSDANIYIFDAFAGIGFNFL